jgi:ABC-type multidrug transport system ATPase subunit
LTAKEHLEIFSEIKRIPKNERNDEIEARLRDVLLFDVRNKQAGKYSGGMKSREISWKFR